MKVHKKRRKGMWSYHPPEQAACGRLICYDIFYRMAWAWKKITCLNCLETKS